MDRVAAAFQKMDRAKFVPEAVATEVDWDGPLPIGYGQTNSQPTTVRLMLEWLDPQPGDTVLDVGSGSGWTTALLAELVGPTGEVYAVERIPELVAFGRANAMRAGVRNAQFFAARKTLGLPQYGPYNRILVSASAPRLPLPLVDQLKGGGKMVIPVRDLALEITKLPTGELHLIPHQGFVFVPLVP